MMPKLKTNLHLLGPQGSGKGTQSEILANKFGYIHISAGDLLRNRASLNDKFAQRLKHILDTGELVPFEIIRQVHEEEISKYPDTKGFIFDGILRNLEQTAIMSKLWTKLSFDKPYLIVLEISDEESIKRLSKRRICPKCNYIAFSKNHEQIICPKCGKAMIQRSDDTKGAILNRLKIYHDETEPVISLFKSRHRAIIIDGCPSIDNVSNAIISALEEINIIHLLTCH